MNPGLCNSFPALLLVSVQWQMQVDRKEAQLKSKQTRYMFDLFDIKHNTGNVTERFQRWGDRFPHYDFPVWGPEIPENRISHDEPPKPC